MCRGGGAGRYNNSRSQFSTRCANRSCFCWKTGQNDWHLVGSSCMLWRCKAEKTLFWFKLTHGARGELFWHAGSQGFNDWQLNGITFLVVLLCYIVDDAMCDLFFVASHHSHQTNNEHQFFSRHIRHINFVDLCEKIHFVLNPSAVE